MNSTTNKEPASTTAAPSYLPVGMPGRLGVTEPVTFIIFGASGDLTHRKLIPALYNLAHADMLPADFTVIGFAFTPMDDNGFREEMRKAVQECGEATAFDEKVWDSFAGDM